MTTPPGIKTRLAHAAIAVLLLATALVRFWRAPADAGARLVTPDGAEYAVAAHRLATLGTLNLDIGGARLPSRYPPLFSVMLAPVYAIAPGETGNGIAVVLGFALLMTGAAYAAGWSAAGTWGGVAAAALVIHHSLLAGLARTIMSDLPAAALAVAALAVFLQMRAGGANGWLWLLAGVMVAVAAGLRPLAGALVLPFLATALRERRQLPIRLAGLLAPLIVVGILMAFYNQRHFGAWWRTGYHFWCPIPYEFPSLTWSARHLWDNAALFAQPRIGLTVLAGAAGVAALFWRKNPAAGRVTAFLLLGALPISLAHLYYFHADERFHVLLVAVCCVAATTGAAAMLPTAMRARPWGAVALAAVSLLLARPPREAHGSNRDVQHYLAAFVPPGGTIVTWHDPVAMEPTVLRPGGRHWVPIWRRQNYAGHAIAPRPIDLPAGAVTWPGSHRQPAIFAAGARDAVPWTATERPDLLAEMIRQGRGVYLDGTVPVGSEPYKSIAKRFALRPVDPEGWVLQLSIRADGDSAAGDRVNPSE